MSRRELMIRGVWTLVISLVCFPAALVFSSGHFGNGLNVVVVIVAAIFGTIFLLPSIAAWLMVEPWAGSVAGGLAVAAAELAWVFFLVSVVRRKLAERSHPDEHGAS